MIAQDRIKVLYLNKAKKLKIDSWDFELIKQLREDNSIIDLWIIDVKNKKQLINTLAESLASGTNISEVDSLIANWEIKDTDLDSHIKDNLKLKKGTKKNEVKLKEKTYKGLSKIESLGLIAKDVGYAPSKMQEVKFDELVGKE